MHSGSGRTRLKFGGFIAYGANISILFGRAAIYVDRILEGRATRQSPGSASDGIRDHCQSKGGGGAWATLPASVLVRADEVIE